MVPTIWLLRAVLFVVLLGAMNLVFTGSVAMGVVAAAAAVSVYLSLRRAAPDTE